MADPQVNAAGGFAAIRYVASQTAASGHPGELVRRLRSHNACKTCALGMGGQQGGMVNESGHFPEVCKKSVQAQVSDLQPCITEQLLARHTIAEFEAMSSREVEKLGRLTFPIAIDPGGQHFYRISWHEALDRVSRAFAATQPERTFVYMSGRSSNEAAFLTQLVGRAYGTPNIHNCSFYCHNASSVALQQVYGSSTSSVDLTDLESTSLAVVVGANPASNHPRLITQLIRLRQRGGKVIVINPIAELGLRRFRLPSDAKSLAFGSQVSDLYLQPRVGGDIAVLLALLKRIRELGATDDDFIARSTRGWDELAVLLDGLQWEDLLAGSAVSRRLIYEAADVIAAADSGIFMWAMGLTHHQHGTDNILALANLALARGFLGRPGSGLLPIRGHSNIQGVGSMGVSPTMKASFAQRLMQHYGVAVDERQGQDTYASMVAAHEGAIDAAILLGGNLWGSNPDSTWASTAMSRIGMTFSMTTTLNQGHFRGRGQVAVIVPVLARDEEPQATTQESMFNFVRFSDGGTPLPYVGGVPGPSAEAIGAGEGDRDPGAGSANRGEARSEVDIVASIAQRILPAGRFDWSSLRSHEDLRTAIAATVDGYQDISAAGRSAPVVTSSHGGRDGVVGRVREFTVAGRVLHDGAFATPDGRAHFHAVHPPELPLEPGELLMMTLRSEGQFNTVVYEERDLYRGNDRRDVVMVSAAEAASRGLAEGDRVDVVSASGRMTVTVAIIAMADHSAAMYYPEANVLVPRRLDPASKTPAFKSVPIRIVRSDSV